MTDTTATATTPAKPEKRKVADKAYVGPDGTTPAEIEDATGVFYVSLADKANGHAGFSYQIPGIETCIGSPLAMLALFGATTLATNEASQNKGRQEKGNADAYESHTDAVAARFAAIVQGDWGTEEGGVGRGIDVPVLLAALNELKPFPDSAASDRVLKRLTDEADYRSMMRKRKEVRPIYDRMIDEKRPAKEEKPLEQVLDW